LKRSGHADLPLHYGQVPAWLHQRMSLLGGAIIESVIVNYGKAEVLRRLSDPLWFQSLGCVLGMDWHSSGITTSVMGALKKALQPKAQELGIYICGGKGKHSRQTPQELLIIANKTGLNGSELVKCSKLSAKVDNTAIMDGFQLYLHSFILTDTGDWCVIQQGMNNKTGMARRYHWHSPSITSFIEDPHTSICGESQGMIINLVDKNANSTQQGILNLTKQDPSLMLAESRKILMPLHHEVKAKDINLKRLGAALAVAHEKDLRNFESLLLLEGIGPRTLQSLVLVSEVIHGTPSKFEDPARFSFAHGGKDGHPFPVPTKVYDETILHLRESVEKAKLGANDKVKALKSLMQVAHRAEKNFTPNPDYFKKTLQKERNDSYKYGGKTVFGDSKPPDKLKNNQLKLF